MMKLNHSIILVYNKWYDGLKYVHEFEKFYNFTYQMFWLNNLIES